METLEQADKLGLDINYLGEIKSLDVTELWTERESPAKIAFEGRNKDQGQPVFRAELWTPPNIRSPNAP